MWSWASDSYIRAGERMEDWGEGKVQSYFVDFKKSLGIEVRNVCGATYMHICKDMPR